MTVESVAVCGLVLITVSTLGFCALVAYVTKRFLDTISSLPNIVSRLKDSDVEIGTLSVKI